MGAPSAGGKLLDPPTDKFQAGCALAFALRPCGRFLIGWRVPYLDSLDRRLACVETSAAFPSFRVERRTLDASAPDASVLTLVASSRDGDRVDLCQSHPLSGAPAAVLFSILAVQGVVDVCLVSPGRGRLASPAAKSAPSPHLTVIAAVSDPAGVFAPRQRAMEVALWRDPLA